MNKYVASLVIGIVITAALIFNPTKRADVSTTRASTIRQILQVQNKTASLEVVNVTEQETSCSLTLRNISPKVINGYSIGTTNLSKVDVDLTIGDRTIAPGEEFTESYPLPGPQKPTTIKMLAVLFTDGTADGEAQVITANQERRKGTKQQLIDILPLLRKALNSSAPDELPKLKSKVSELPEESASNDSPQSRTGKSGAKQDTISRLEMMTQDGVDSRKELRDLIKDIEERISRLKTHSP